MNNPLKERLAAGEWLYACWLTLASPKAAEALACAGFDFLVVDGEHSPADTMDTVALLQAIAAGGSQPIVRVTVTLRNPTDSAYTGVQLSDTLPGEVLTIVPDSAATTCGGTVSITPPRTVSLSDGKVPPGTPESPGSCTIIVQVTAPADAGPGSYRNTIPASSLATDQGITNGQAASSWVTISPAGGALGARKSFSPSTMAVDENSRLRVNIPAPQDIDLTNFSVTDNLPPGVTISNSSPASQSNCGPSAVLTAVTGAASFTLANATLRAGTVCQIDVYVTSRTPGLHTNVIRPADISNDQNRTIPDDIAADLTVTALSDFEISKAFTPPSVRPGRISTLGVTLENPNTGPLVDASG